MARKEVERRYSAGKDRRDEVLSGVERRDGAGDAGNDRYGVLWFGPNKTGKENRMKLEQVQTELEQIRKANNGLLKPEHVVEFAKDPNTALHRHFEWDDTEAARLFRLVQAGAVIRLCVTVLQEDVPPVRTYVSLPSDRVEGGGYRSTREVVNDESRRQEMLRDALERLNAWKRRYAHLQALLPVFDAMERVERAATG